MIPGDRHHIIPVGRTDMAKIHISEIQKILVQREEKDAIPDRESGFLIRFDEHNHATTVIDEEF